MPYPLGHGADCDAAHFQIICYAENMCWSRNQSGPISFFLFIGIESFPRSYPEYLQFFKGHD